MSGKFNLQLFYLFAFVSSPEALCAFPVFWEQWLFISINKKEMLEQLLTWKNGFIKHLNPFDCCKFCSVLFLLSHASLLHESVFSFLLFPSAPNVSPFRHAASWLTCLLLLGTSGKHEAPNNNSCCPIAIYQQPSRKAYLLLCSLCWKPQTSMWSRGPGWPVSSLAQHLAVRLLRNRLPLLNECIILMNGLELAT